MPGLEAGSLPTQTKRKRKNKKQKIVYVKMSLTPSRNNGFQNMLKLGEPARDRSTYFIS